eukprot:jgi/Botrbrau1/11988/Bobra.0115s0024.1
MSTLPDQPLQFSYPEGLPAQQHISDPTVSSPQCSTQNQVVRAPCPSSRPDSTLPGPPDQAATEPACQGKSSQEEGAPEIGHGPSEKPLQLDLDQSGALDTLQQLARGGSDSGQHQRTLERAQQSLRNTPPAPVILPLNGPSRAQRYEHRTAARELLLAQEKGESCERVGVTECDSESQGPGEVQERGQDPERPELHVSDERGTVSDQTENGPSELRSMGGTCPVPEGIVRDVSSVCYAQRQCGASHTSVGLACEGAAGPAPQRSCLVGSRQRERETWAQHQDRPSVRAVQRFNCL